LPSTTGDPELHFTAYAMAASRAWTSAAGEVDDTSSTNMLEFRSSAGDLRHFG